MESTWLGTIAWLHLLNAILVGIVAFWVGSIIYNLYFHPLASIPGPVLWRASRLSFIRSLVSGRLVADIRQFHQTYGDIVRTAPNEISFSHVEAWHDICTPTKGHKQLLRNNVWFKAPPGQPENLVTTVSAVDSARMRQVVAPAFTDRAVMRQEAIIQGYAHLLVNRFKEKVCNASDSTSGVVINVVDWLNWFTFDSIGELALGESFGCLQDTKHHPWIELLSNSLGVMALAAATRYHRGLESILWRLIPAKLRKMQSNHYATALNKIQRRMSSQVMRPDFMSHFLENNPGFEKMSQQEVESTLTMLLIVGSETTATALCGALHYLVQYPDALQKLEHEIRGNFANELDISFRSLHQLPYLSAVISETLRLCNPVAGGIMRIVPEQGATVCGYSLPSGTHVTLSPVAMSLSATNFNRADEFLPERFLPEAERPAEFGNDVRDTQKPFGLGTRSCLGKPLAMAEMRLVLAQLVWNFDLSQAPCTRINWNELKTFVVVQKEPVYVVLKKRRVERRV
ncbi:cytochrome P450 [Xylaria bambusicola]|uniref:cytochrome P450 n=1 Tax=Xylaria bambusicola TaxID=326684 RepID=UPI00200825E7|nr:cytochrome P450 [Xylaria bambusicola]KAI0509177.1 cytochrome P450 [Xylaria bambusicola]